MAGAVAGNIDSDGEDIEFSEWVPTGWNLRGYSLLETPIHPDDGAGPTSGINGEKLAALSSFLHGTSHQWIIVDCYEWVNAVGVLARWRICRATFQGKEGKQSKKELEELVQETQHVLNDKNGKWSRKACEEESADHKGKKRVLKEWLKEKCARQSELKLKKTNAGIKDERHHEGE